MKIFYTVSSREGDPQTKASMSLGGYQSGSPVPNGAFYSLFSDISIMTIERALPEYVGLIIRNVLEKTFSSVKLWVEVPAGGICKYRLAVVELSDSGEMELLPTLNSQPFVGEFQDAVSEETAIVVNGAFSPESQFGVWVERVIDSNSDGIKYFNDPEKLYSNPSLFSEKIEVLSFKVKYDE